MPDNICTFAQICNNMDDIIKQLKSISNETRIRILRLLKEKSWLCECEISAKLGFKPYTVSRHLKELLNANLIIERKDGRFRRFALKQPSSEMEQKLFDFIVSIESEKITEDIKNLKSTEAINQKCILPQKINKEEKL